jgi:hypothetical protein
MQNRSPRAATLRTNREKIVSRRRMNAAETIEPARSEAAPKEPPAGSDVPSPAERKSDSFRKMAFMLWVGPLLLFVLIGILKWVFGF